MKMPPVDVVMTTVGGKDIARTIRQSPALLGYEAWEKAPDGNIEFIDFPFGKTGATEGKFNAVLRAVETHEPKIAVAPDVEGPVDLDRAVEYGDQLLEAGADHVVITPKEANPQDVPDRFRLGYPAANIDGSDIATFLGSWMGRDGDGVHVLGGSPTVQLELARQGLPVKSVDGSAVERGSRFFDIWTPNEGKHWQHAGDYSDHYERVGASLKNVAKAWADFYGEDHPEVDRYIEPDEVGETGERVAEETRMRMAGRGPPVADPHTGEILESGHDDPEKALADADLETRDRMKIRAIRDELGRQDEPEADETATEEQPDQPTTEPEPETQQSTL